MLHPVAVVVAAVAVHLDLQLIVQAAQVVFDCLCAAFAHS